ncbi:MAG TPA: carbon monoxide dehydrogenase, partial [Thermopolyspora sp.]
NAATGPEDTKEKAATGGHLAAVPAEQRPPGATRTSRTANEEALDLLEIAGMPIFKRLAPVVGGLALLVLAILLIRRLVRG